jgi:hypothetical protein
MDASVCYIKAAYTTDSVPARPRTRESCPLWKATAISFGSLLPNLHRIWWHFLQSVTTLVSASGRQTSLQTFSCLPSAVRPRFRTATAMDAPWRRSAVTPPLRFTVNQLAYSCPRKWELLPGCGIRQLFACRRLRYHPFRWQGRSDAGGFRQAQRDLDRYSNYSGDAKWLLIEGNGPLQSPGCIGVFEIMFPDRSEIDVAFARANHGLEIRTVVTRQHAPEFPPAIILRFRMRSAYS